MKQKLKSQHRSCGTVTTVGTSTQFESFTGGETTSCDTSKDIKDTANWCNTALYTDRNGHADGEMGFIYIDCNGGGLLKDSEIIQSPQDPMGPRKQPKAIFYLGVFTGATKDARF